MLFRQRGVESFDAAYVPFQWYSVITSMWSYAPDSPISVKLGGDLVTDPTSFLSVLTTRPMDGGIATVAKVNGLPSMIGCSLLRNHTCLGPKTTCYPLMMRFHRGRESRSSLRVAQQWSSTSATLGSEDVVSSTSKCRGCLRYLTTG